MVERDAGRDPDLPRNSVDREGWIHGSAAHRERVGDRVVFLVGGHHGVADRITTPRILPDRQAVGVGRERRRRIRCPVGLGGELGDRLLLLAGAVAVGVDDLHPQVLVAVVPRGCVRLPCRPRDDHPGRAAAIRPSPLPHTALHLVGVCQRRREWHPDARLLRGERERPRLLQVCDVHRNVLAGDVERVPVRGFDDERVARPLLEVGRLPELQHAVCDRELAALRSRERPDDRGALRIHGPVRRHVARAPFGVVDVRRSIDGWAARPRS